MRAEVRLDCGSEVIETSDRFLLAVQRNGRAVQIPGGRVQNLLPDGLRSVEPRDRQDCGGSRRRRRWSAQVTILINGETTTGKLVQGKVVARLSARLRDRQPGGRGRVAIYERLP